MSMAMSLCPPSRHRPDTAIKKFVPASPFRAQILRTGGLPDNPDDTRTLARGLLPFRRRVGRKSGKKRTMTPAIGPAKRSALSVIALTIIFAQQAHARSENPDERAARVEAQMTDDERVQLLHGGMPGFPGKEPTNIPADIKPTAGYVKGVSRLGVPDLLETDASLGVVNPLGAREGDVATALPSSLSLAASFDTSLAYRSGAMIGSEARAKGFNMLLAGGVNLTRDWYSGRNFEYLGEDPLLAGILAGESIRGVQSARIMSTVKHFALNSQETQRRTVDGRIGEAALRESDLLAFEIAIERGHPASVMCAYNLVNGAPSCGNRWLLEDVLRGDWGYQGWVMSDWGTTHDVSWFNNGLDQQSGSELDKKVWFDKPLKAELASGGISRERLSQAVRRILRSIYAVDADGPLTETPIDYDAHAAIARETAANGIVLLKNRSEEHTSELQSH